MSDETIQPDPLATQAMPARQPGLAIGAAGRPLESSTGSGRLEVRCPGCHQPIDVAADTSLTDLTCSSCGSHFSLVDQSKATRIAPSLSQMGRFELIERLGVGGFGSVWKARDKELDRTVAIKIPRQGGMTAEETEKFFREARAAAQLHHPNIVSVHEVGRDGDSVYIVSDYVRGVTLGDWLTGQQLTNREAAELCAKIADALHHAHEQGVVHRDLKPANIMMGYEGEPHLMDFGLARRETGEVTMTMDGQILGTPAYMSPEQAEGEGHNADRRSDVYSLGVILFQLLTGELPFRGNARMLIKQVVQDEPPSPRKLNGNVSKDLETITLKCLEKDPNRRYQSSELLAAELRRYMSGEPILARPTGQIERAWRWCCRNQLVAGLSASALLILCGGTVVSTIFGLEAQRQSRSAMASREQAEKALVKEEQATEEAIVSKEEALREKREAMKSLYYAQMMAIPAQIEQARFERARQMLHDAPTQFRSWEWGYFARLCNLDLGTIEEPGPIFAAAFSPDGSTFATAGSSGICTISSWPDFKKLHAFSTQGDGVTSLAFSPDGKLLVTGQSGSKEKPGRATVWDTATGKEVTSLVSDDRGVKSVGFSRDGGTIATGGFDKTTRLWDPRTGEQIRVLETRPAVVKSLAFSPTDDILVTADQQGDNIVKIWNPASGEKVHELPAEPMGIESLAFSPDGKTLAIGTKTTEHVHFWSTGIWTRIQYLPVDWYIWGLAFSPDGTHLACASRNTIVRICANSSQRRRSLLESFLGSVTPEWQLANLLKGHEDHADAVAFSRDNRFLLTGSSDGTSKVWAVEPIDEITTFNATSEGNWPYANTVRFTKDGGSIAAAKIRDPYAQVWDVKTGIERIRLGPHPTDVRSLDISGDGQRLVVAADGVRLWDLSTGATSVLATESKASVECVAFSPDHQMVAAAVGERAIILDLATNQIIKKTPDHTYSVSRVCFSPNGKLLATITSKLPHTLSLWDLENLSTPLFTRTIRRRTSDIAFSPDGERIAVAAGSSPDVLSVKTGKLLLSLDGHSDYVTDIAFSPDAAHIATVTVTGALGVWDAADGRELFNMADAAPWLYCTEFSPDGKYLAFGGRRRNDDGAAVYLLQAFPWTSGATVDGSPKLEDFAELKRSELNRRIKADNQRPKPLKYTIKEQ